MGYLSETYLRSRLPIAYFILAQSRLVSDGYPPTLDSPIVARFFKLYRVTRLKLGVTDLCSWSVFPIITAVEYEVLWNFWEASMVNITYIIISYSGNHTLIGTVGDQWISWLRTLLWRHNGQGGVSNHQPHDCLLNRLFGCRSKKTSKLRVTGLCVGNSPGTGEFPAQMASNAENVSIWWRHHDCIRIKHTTSRLDVKTT